ncbi:DUF1877 family protein [Nonomuraea indica]|uniref:DUF1877 family protein n=1 Tax=Nonomuraea indica TaxID=1581193 RepID=UPI000C7CF290|nr:DUF1877 family protein [Nonomuraea indica]
MSAVLTLYRVEADAAQPNPAAAAVGDPLDLGQSWDLLQTLLAGDRNGWSGHGDAELAIVGGLTSQTTAGGMLISIDAARVCRVAAYLARVSFADLVSSHYRAVESACGGDPARILDEDLRPRLNELRDFYRVAAGARNAVVKRISG